MKTRRQSNEALDLRLDDIEAGKHVLSAFKNGAFSFSSNTNETITLDGYDSDRSRGITSSGSQISFTKAGLYKVTITARYNTDVWFKHFMKNAAGTIIGESNWAGGGNSPGTYVFIANVGSPQVCTLLAYASSPGMSIQTPAPAGSPQGQVNRTFTVTIEEM
jgi:hypothetical protein